MYISLFVMEFVSFIIVFSFQFTMFSTLKFYQELKPFCNIKFLIIYFTYICTFVYLNLLYYA